MTFLMPPDYRVNNEMMVESVFTAASGFYHSKTAHETWRSSVRWRRLVTIAYTVTHADTSRKLERFSCQWFAAAATVVGE